MAELQVEVVAAAGIAWEGAAISVTARTSEGDIGILANHEPILATLVPCVAEILTSDGNREVIVVDGGFISVAENRVSLLSPLARIASEIDVTARRTRTRRCREAAERRRHR